MGIGGENIGGSRIIGQSNLCESDSVEITCQSGSLFVFFKRKVSVKKPRPIMSEAFVNFKKILAFELG